MRASLTLALLLCPGVIANHADAQGQPSEPELIGISSQRIEHATDEPGNWLDYSGQYNGQRFSTLKQITSENVMNLKVKWIRQFPITELFETTPLVVDGVMFITIPANIICALDARSGLKYWQMEYPMKPKLAFCCGKVNRGLAMLGETLYKGTLDAKILAVDAKSGSIRWEVQVEQPEAGYSITAAPLIVKDMVVTGIAGGEYGALHFPMLLDRHDIRRKSPLSGFRNRLRILEFLPLSMLQNLSQRRFNSWMKVLSEIVCETAADGGFYCPPVNGTIDKHYLAVQIYFTDISRSIFRQYAQSFFILT